MKLPGSTKNRITENKNGENTPHLEIAQKVLLAHCKIVCNDYQHDSRVLYKINFSIRYFTKKCYIFKDIYH